MFNIFKSFLLIIFLFFVLISKSYSETLKISFVDMDKIIAVSTAGKKVQKSINSLIKKEEEKFKKKEADLKKKEEEILKQKNIISKDELDKKIKEFQKDLSDFRNERAKFNRSINKKNLEATNKMVNAINKILTQYAADNSLSLVIQKKNIIIGKSELDITDEILKEFNNQVKSIN